MARFLSVVNFRHRSVEVYIFYRRGENVCRGNYPERRQHLFLRDIYGVEYGKLGYGRSSEPVDCGAGEHAVRAAGVNFFGARVFERLCALEYSAGGIN